MRIGENAYGSYGNRTIAGAWHGCLYVLHCGKETIKITQNILIMPLLDDFYSISLNRNLNLPSAKSCDMILKCPISDVLETCVPMHAQAS